MAPDLFTVDLLDSANFYVLAVIEHSSRGSEILGVTAEPNTAEPNTAWVTPPG